MKRLFALLGLIALPLFAQTMLQGQDTFHRNALMSQQKATVASGPSPVGWWKFNDGSGTNAVDSSGNGNTGTLNGTNPGLPTWGTGPNGNGDLVFSPTNNNQYVDCGASAALKPTSAGTFSCWVYTIAGTVAYTQIMGNGNFATDRNGFMLGTWSGSHFAFEIADGAGYEDIIGTSSWPNNGWTFVCGTWGSGDGKIHLYFNGVEEGTGTSTSRSPSPAYNFTIGGTANGTAALFLRASVDDARVYNVSLTAAQILTIYQAGAQ